LRVRTQSPFQDRSAREVTRERFDAVLFDLDGVVTSTAALHMAAWKCVFDAFLDVLAPGVGIDRRPFDERDYRVYVDGKPRYDGVRGFVASRAVTLAEGHPDDPPGRETVCGLGNRKNEVFRAELDARGATAFPSTVGWIGELRRQEFKTAVVTASRNGAAVLAATGVADLFDVVFDGNTASRLGIAGKPAPDTYVAAARMLDVETRRAVVVEDAIAGVRAGRDGGFGLVIGLAGPDDADEMLDNGADIVVADLGEMSD
jgi:alpha,alpha-trehalase